MAPQRNTALNEEIVATQVRLIDVEGGQLGIVSLETALRKAEEKGMDLVQMAGDSDPVVCRLMDYGKHLFAAKKSQAAARKRQKRTQVKEVKFRLSTDEADYRVKLRNLERFLLAGDKTKVSIRLRGREILRRDQSLALLDRISNDLSECSKVEQEAKLEGRQMLLTLAPLRRQARPKAREAEASATAEAAGKEAVSET